MFLITLYFNKYCYNKETPQAIRKSKILSFMDRLRKFSTLLFNYTYSETITEQPVYIEACIYRYCSVLINVNIIFKDAALQYKQL